MIRRSAVSLSFACGFSSLSLEILWVRLYGFAKLSTPTGLGFVLMAYLIGIAVGAHVGSRACKKLTSEKLWIKSSYALLISALLTMALPLMYAESVKNGVDNVLIDAAIIALSSSLIAYIFPIAHHLGADSSTRGRQGRHFASVYLANVIGAALGPLVTGYFLLENFSLQQSFAVISVLQIICGIALLTVLGSHVGLLRWSSGMAAALAIAASVPLWLAHPHALIAAVNDGPSPLIAVIENRHGIITVAQGKGGDDSVYGGNVYDGRTNVDLLVNTNGVDRVAILAQLQPRPRRVLMIGSSIGSWLAIVRQFPHVQHIDVIEINPGYLVAAQPYKPQSDALNDSRVSIYIDDARRWLRSRKAGSYDLVVMNTTWHWRANSTLLLSKEFLALVKDRVAPHGVLAFNTTGSPDAFNTAAHVFDHAYLYGNFVYAADFDFRPRKGDAQELLRHFNYYRKFSDQERSSAKIFFSKPFISLNEIKEKMERPLEIITDKNMITEFKYGVSVY